MKDKREILKQAFWSGVPTYRQFRGYLRDPIKHKKSVATAFRHLPLNFIINEYGQARFIKDWPEIRKDFHDDAPLDQKPLNAFDVIWGLLAVGDSQYPVSSTISNISKKRRDILRQAIEVPGISVYELAKKQKRDYSSVYRDVRYLINKTLIKAIKGFKNGRAQKKICVPDSMNTQLAGF